MKNEDYEHVVLLRNAQTANAVLREDFPKKLRNKEMTKRALELIWKAIDAVREYKYFLERQLEIEDDDEDGE